MNGLQELTSSIRVPLDLVEATPIGTDPSSDRCLEVQGCLAIGDAELRSRTYPGGPTIVRGAHSLFDANGDPVELSRRIVAICRCGKSQLAPLCDGTHRFVPGFAEER